MLIENASKPDLLRYFFANIPGDDADTIDREVFAKCESVIDELRARAVRETNLTLLRDVHTLEIELHSRLAEIQERVGVRRALSGLSIPGAR